MHSPIASNIHARTAACAGHPNNRRPLGRGFQQAFAGLAVLLFTAHLSAQTPSAPAICRELSIVGNSPAGVNVSATAAQTVTVNLLNRSAQSITVSQVGAIKPESLQAISPITLATGERKPLTLTFDASSVMIPGQIPVYLKISDSAGERTVMVPMPLSSSTLVAFAPRVLSWTQTGTAQAKSSQVINLPEGKTIKAIQVSDPAFTATVQGNTVTVTPADTAQAHTATVTVVTEPESDRVPMLLVQISAKVTAQNAVVDGPEADPALTVQSAKPSQTTN